MSSDSLSCLQSLADTEAGHQLRDFNELSVSKNGCVCCARARLACGGVGARGGGRGGVCGKPGRRRWLC